MSAAVRGVRDSCLYWPPGGGGLVRGRQRRPKSHEGRLGDQTGRGASRSERLSAREHVPDRGRQLAGELDPGDLAAPLLAEPARGALVAARVARMAGGMGGRLDQRPAQVLRASLGQRSAAIGRTRLVDARAEAGVGDEPVGAGEARDVASGPILGDLQHRPQRRRSEAAFNRAAPAQLFVRRARQPLRQSPRRSPAWRSA